MNHYTFLTVARPLAAFIFKRSARPVTGLIVIASTSCAIAQEHQVTSFTPAKTQVSFSKPPSPSPGLHLVNPSLPSVACASHLKYVSDEYIPRPELNLRHLSATSVTEEESGYHGKQAEQAKKSSSYFAWIDEEAQDLIAKAYSRHKALADKSESFPPSLSIADLEKIGTPYSFPPQDLSDRLALGLMKCLRVFVHAFFREKYDHHAVCLETVAAVPGLVGSWHRHLRSLRRMKRDHGWITIMQEEAENERMHLLIFMKVCEPTPLERTLVIVAQALYLLFYSSLYLTHPRGAHRLTGYLEEEAHRAYTDYLESIDSGKLPNKPAPLIARQYYNLPDDAKMRDVVLHVRADEAMHRNVNHTLGNKYGDGDIDSFPNELK